MGTNFSKYASDIFFKVTEQIWPDSLVDKIDEE